MRKIWKYVGIVALVVVLALGTVAAVAFAQGGTGDSGGPFNYYERFRQTLADILGISVEQYDSAVEQARDKVLNDAVAEGWLTQDQADRMRERANRGPGDMMWGKGPDFGHGWGRGGWGADLLAVAADQLGMSRSDLLAALQDGKTIADLARDKDVDPQVIVDAYVAKVQEGLNQAVSDGRITQKMADALLEEARTRAGEQINAAWKYLPPGGFPGGHGRGPRWNCPGNEGATDTDA